ncbi:cytochrome c oxidase subunit 3 family protein [Gordonia pseudamarae]|jgi:nitric oxide reductase NorE protein|uniref:Cytochrome aa3 subunit 3 n=1 Tax=Gordonia pseudamarae TaxID=2831662 RepID=A0ABX6IJC3_9ACTN|nr:MULTISPECIES: cytochrome c oxidase subunit 3 [Gordonia]MBD0023189.1 cytochrome c oxidase subunit 3 [Gordonia sp. (in: high G+C Gram-positive bacteria)]QHN27099.1 cytochrome c oxidase subunit 3 family protein [Gordonia pseudamarae]QHN35988.1 cytochrome c oxidase subunit 3 family protein [Gordonia pseudamarae]
MTTRESVLPPPVADNHSGPSAHPRRVPGEPGLWLIILGDIVMFAVLLCVLLYYRSSDRAGYAAAQSHLSISQGLAETLVLLASSLAVVVAVVAYRAQRIGRANGAMLIALGLGAAFTVLKVVEWSTHAADGLTPHSNDFFMLYYILTGLHLGHVVVGMFVLELVRRMAKRPLPGKHDTDYFVGAAVFWHMVDLIWLFLAPLLFLVV